MDRTCGDEGGKMDKTERWDTITKVFGPNDWFSLTF